MWMSTRQHGTAAPVIAGLNLLLAEQWFGAAKEKAAAA
jgi:hypothetical protein